MLVAFVQSIFLPAAIAAVIALCVVYMKLPKCEQHHVRKLLYREGMPIIIGHRAGGFEAPENTLLSIETAYKNGATAVEVDLDFTKDGVPVMFHDETVDRMTNGTGRLDSFLYEDLKKLNMAAKQNTLRVRNEEDRTIEFEPIPTFDEVMALCMKLGLTVILDCKSNPDLTIKALKDVLKKYPNAPEYVVVTSFNFMTAYKARYHCPEFVTGIIWRYHYLSREINGDARFGPVTTFVYDVLDWISSHVVHSSLLEWMGVGVVSMHKDHLSRKYVNDFSKRGINVVAWTVNDPKEKEFMLCNYRVPVITDSMLDDPKCPEQTI